MKQNVITCYRTPDKRCRLQELGPGYQQVKSSQTAKAKYWDPSFSVAIDGDGASGLQSTYGSEVKRLPSLSRSLSRTLPRSAILLQVLLTLIASGGKVLREKRSFSLEIGRLSYFAVEITCLSLQQLFYIR